MAAAACETAAESFEEGLSERMEQEDVPGLQTPNNRFDSFLYSEEYFQSRFPSRGICHDRIPSLMELSLILEEQIFEFGFWKPKNKKHFGESRWRIDPNCEAMKYARRRQLLLEIALFAYDFNESLLMNDEHRALSMSDCIVECGTPLELSGVIPVPISHLICSFLAEDFDYVRRDVKSEHRQMMTKKDRLSLSNDTQRMLMANQSRSKYDCDGPQMSESEVLSIRDASAIPGLFWDFQIYKRGLNMAFDERRIGSVPTPLIREFSETGIQFINVNVLVAAKGDEMWMGIHSMPMNLTEWPRTPAHAVYYYGGRKGTIARHKGRVLEIEKSVDQDGCWGNIQHESQVRLFKEVHLPYYQPGDWVSFQIDTLNQSMDIWLNNELIIRNADCSDIPMPWTFVSVVDANHDLLYIEQVSDICGSECNGFVDGSFYREKCEIIRGPDFFDETPDLDFLRTFIDESVMQTVSEEEE